MIKKISVYEVVSKLGPNDMYLARDTNLLAGINRAIETINDPQEALLYAFAYRNGLLDRKATPENYEPLTANGQEPANQPTQAAINEARETARQAGALAGALSERKRICAIMSDPLAADRMDTARHLSFGTDMTSAQAIAFLKTVTPTTVAEAIQKIPETVARACNTQGGLVAFDATLGSIAPVEAGSVPAGAALGFILADDPLARNSPKADAKASWKKIVGDLNAETDNAIRA